MSGDWMAGYEQRSFEVDGGPIVYYELTESMASVDPPIVLVHGMRGSALEHCELGRRLARCGPVYLIDLRLHGLTPDAPDHAGAGSLADQVAIVTAFLREIVGRPAVLIGNSFGTMVAANVARATPGQVLRLVLIGPATKPSAFPIEPKRFVQGLIAKPSWVRERFDASVRAGKRREDADSLIATATPYLELLPNAFVEALRGAPAPAWSADHPSGRAHLWQGLDDAIAVLSHPRRWRALLNELAMPALWLHGADDPLMPKATLAEVRRALPRWRVDVVPATGHLPHLERVDWTAERIGSWLQTETAAAQGAGAAQ